MLRVFTCWWAHPSGRLERHERYENYILNEVFPFMHLKNSHECVISHGCSLGAFHAANIAFRHPICFKNSRLLRTLRSNAIGGVRFDDLWVVHYDDAVYFNTPTHYLSNLGCAERLDHLRKMDMVFIIGDEDPFKGNNEDLVGFCSRRTSIIAWCTGRVAPTQRLLLAADGTTLCLVQVGVGRRLIFEAFQWMLPVSDRCGLQALFCVSDWCCVV